MSESTLSPELAIRLRKQLDTWRSDLLTLDRRQRLLYFAHTRTASLEISQPGLADILGIVTRGRGTVLPGVADGETKLPWAGPDDLVAHNKNAKDLVAAVRRLDQTSQQVYADRGFWTLYVGLGMLQWIDPVDDRTVVSPLVLVPVRLRRGGSQEPYFVERTEDEPVLNPSLRLKVERDFGVDLPEYDPEVDDIADCLADVAEVAHGRRGWDVLERVVMTTFSFHKEAIYRDLTENAERVLSHEVVQLLGLGPDAPAVETLGFAPHDPNTLDDAVPPEKLVSILDADSSQRQCILAARDGRSFVMDGPPGTGKSQTIANIVAELMAAGRSVLFVSEKAAALDVVRKRLTDAALDPFLLELHSHSATRKQVSQELAAALGERPRATRGTGGADEHDLAAHRRALSAYAAAVNDVRPGFGRSLHWALGELASTEGLRRFTLTPDPRWKDLTAAGLADMVNRAESLSRAWAPVIEGDYFVWRDLERDDLDASETQRVRERLVSARTSSEALVHRLQAVDADLGIPFPYTINGATRRASLLSHLQSGTQVPEAWLTTTDLSAAVERAQTLRTDVTELIGAVDQLEETVGPAWGELDPDRDRALAPLCSDPSTFGLAATSTDRQVREALAVLAASTQRLVEIDDDAKVLAHLFGVEPAGVTIDLAHRLASLARLGATPTPPEPSWLRPGVQDALVQSARVLQELVTVVQQRQAALSEVFTNAALQLDLHALNTRFRDTHRGLRRWGSAARADRKVLKEATVGGRVDRTVLARLDEAVAWQQAERALDRSADDVAPALGRYYRRTDTDFGRVAAALSAAHEAVRLAGTDLDPRAIAVQLSVEADQDPRLTTVGARLESKVAHLHSELRRALPSGVRGLDEAPLLPAAELCADLATRLRPASDALDHVAAVKGQEVAVHEAPDMLARARRAARLHAALIDDHETDAVLLGPRFRSVDTDFDALDADLVWAGRVRELLDGPVSSAVAQRLFHPSFASSDVSPLINQWMAARDQALEPFRADRRELLTRELDEDLETASLVLDEMHQLAPTQIDVWCSYVRHRAWLAAAGVHEVVVRLETEHRPADEVVPAVRRAVLLAWVDSTIKADPALENYRATDRDALARRFRDLDREHIRQAYATVVNACAARRPSSNAGKPAQILTREGQKKTRHIPVRRLLEEAGDLVQLLKPCFMMSPLSVSQYLPPTMTFDVVIFDEASQVLPSDAINSVYRGRQLVVAGDQKQLPPTSFFTRAVEDDEDVDDDDALDVFDSVLDLCKAAGGMQSLPLTWHYRSQHEDLITYSNYRFYEGTLHTFPGAAFQAPDLGVESFVVDGVYRRGGGRDNPIEAERVVDRVVEHRTSHPELSLGVVTFSVAQEDAVLAALEARAKYEPVLDGILDEHDRLDGFFVKNLENVQGDERDVIVFSIGYGPDEHGKFTMNFGPLNPKGGWRRLNVAITRARRRVEVVSSFRPEQMRDTTSDGVRHLRGYLDFAHRGIKALSVEVNEQVGDAESPFEEEVAKVIRSWGYEAVPQVGSAGYRIDIAVRHPELSGQYLLAVECDGAAYHSSKVARDRDRLRQNVLEGLGWAVHRIWGISWVRDRKGQEDRLRTAIDDALYGRGLPPTEVPAQRSVEIDEIDFDAAPEWATPYVRALPGWSGWDQPGRVDALPALRAYVERVVDREGPIHVELIMRNLREDTGVGRIGSQIRDNLNRALASARIASQPVVGDAAGFYRVQFRHLPVVRVPYDEDGVRKPALVPPEELDLAVMGVIQDAGSVDVEQVLVVVGRMFGWRRTGTDVRVHVEAAVSRCERDGRVIRSSTGNLSPA